MKQGEAGQGFIEYALILVLVAIVVISLLLKPGPVVANVFCGIVASIGDPNSPSGDCITAEDDHVYTPQGTSITIDVANNDSALPGFMVDSTSAILIDGPSRGPYFGIVENNRDGTFTYTPYITRTDFIGIDSFHYQIWAEPPAPSEITKVTVGVGVFVKASDDCIDLDPTQSIDVVENDFVLSESEVGPITPPPENFSIEYSNPLHGRLTYYEDAGRFYYAADPDYSGPDDFEYTICNLDGVCDEALVTIYVNTTYPWCPSTITASAAGSGDFSLTTHHTVSPLLLEVQDGQSLTQEDTGVDLTLQHLLLLNEEVTNQDAAFKFAGYPAKEILHSIIEVLLTSDELNEETKDSLQAIVQDFNSGDEEMIISSMVELSQILGLISAGESNQVVAVIREHFLAACDALAGVQVSSYEVALEALYSLEEEEPGSTGDAIPELEEIGLVIQSRNEFVAYSTENCPLILEAFLDWDDLHQAIADAAIPNEGVRQSFHDQAREAKTAFYSGNDKKSGNTLCALLNHLDAQDGKHVDPASAEEIHSTTTVVAAQLGIPLPCNK